jgi:CHASE2 domain-containing sensor protein
MFYSLNKNAQGIVSSYFNKTQTSQDIVIVEIDDKSTRNIERFPFDRKKYIPVIERLNKE